ncbi:MAG: ATP-dependent DNA helicase RecG [Lachnospiraceae bacterium]|nr:ATP-dependent DNA helicase RecG [Lachnospiraceae bacterium]
MNLSDDIKTLKGVGEKTAALFNRVGVFSLWDLLMYIPRDYEVYPDPVSAAEVKPGETAAVLLTVKTDPTVIHVKRLSILSVLAADKDGNALKLKWFNSPYLKKLLYKGLTKVFYGKISVNGSSLEMEHPKFFDKGEYEKMTGVMQPVYPLTKGLTSKSIGQAVEKVLEEGEIEDFLALGEREKLNLMDNETAIRTLHSPETRENILRARKRISFNEFLIFMLNIKRVKADRGRAENGFKMMESAAAKRVIERLPYALTGAQEKAYRDIISDMGADSPMNRLLQGDTGSGKTIIAFLAMITAAENGHQAAIMAPTEVLARQHAEKLNKLILDASLPFKTVLLTGSLSAKERREARAMTESGEASLIVGTHAIIQEGVNFKDLALAVTDEQHRFGVKQRETLSGSEDSVGGAMPHVLVMSATPLPRTLAIILYGDLDISVMDEMPGERLPIKNCVVGTEYRKTAYSFIEKEIEKGHQAYVICPMVEASEAVSSENVIDYAEKLRGIYGSRASVGLLHGRMKSKEKNEIMERFASGDTDILVSTTVIEVGVDVPNATVMMIENAERFGLSSLHQIRGRVGRGGSQGYCIFIDTSGDEKENKRLAILNKTNDGFKIADEDLKLRGPGDVFGIRQSGEMDFRVADIYNDADMLRLAAEYSKRMDKDTEERLEKYVRYEGNVIL